MSSPVFTQVQIEMEQAHDTRKHLFRKLEKSFGRPVVSFFTSFNPRFQVMIDDSDADMLEGLLRKMDLSRGLALIISSPGGSGLAAERIVNICRSYSGTGDFWVIVPGKAKSAATMISFGASKIMMNKTSELGPVDPQLALKEDGETKVYSVYQLREGYKKLFNEAVNLSEGRRVEPYLQQLAHYDHRMITELESAIQLSNDISIRTLASGMMRDTNAADIEKKIEIFLTPKHTKTHGRPIGLDEAKGCGLTIEDVGLSDSFWGNIYELYIRSYNFSNVKAPKMLESERYSFVLRAQ